MDKVSVLFLGTCACDFSERLNTDLKNTLDKDVRRSSSALVDGKILIDCGPHTLNSLDILNIPYSNITDILITHLHDDHFNPEAIAQIAKSRHTPLKIWLREDATLDEISGVELVRMTPYEKYTLNEGTAVTGLVANHDEDAFPHHLLIEIRGKKILYACDGAWLLNKTYYHLHNAHLSVAVLDCTSGDYEGDYRAGEHNSIPMLRVMLPALKTFGVIDDKTKVYFSHLAPSLHKSHGETEKIAHTLGAFVAYDGLCIEA